MSYFDHNDSKGQLTRAMVAAHKADRARMLATLEEYTLGDITLCMSKHDTLLALRESARLTFKV